MTKKALELLQKALALPEADRAALAGSLLESLDQVVDADAEVAWQNEVSRRIADLDSGKAKTVPWEELRSRLAARLGNRNKPVQFLEEAAQKNSNWPPG